MDERSWAIVWMAAASLVWAGAGVSFKLFSLLGYAFVSVFLATRLFKLLAVWFAARYRAKEREPIRSTKELAIIFLNACFSVGTPLFFFLAISHTTVSNAYFLQYTMPAWVLIAAVLFLGEKPSAKKTFGVALTLVGVFLIAEPWRGFSVNLGVLFGLLSGLSYTGDIVTARELKGYSYHTVAFYTNLMQLIIAAALTPLIFGSSSARIEPVAMLAFAAIGILLGIASDMYYHALELIEASTAAIASFSELLFAALLAFLIFSEAPKGNEIFGYALILFASIIIILRKGDIARFEHLLRFTDKM